LKREEAYFKYSKNDHICTKASWRQPFASDLSNGINTYILVVDGKIIETKKMMKQQ